MDNLLVVGVDTVVGANLACCFAEHFHVSTWAADPGYEIANCDALDPTATASRVVEIAAPKWIVYCGPAARSAWEPGTRDQITDDVVAEAQDWATVARKHNARFVMISSDAVFTGPWMFHDEESHGHCHSYQAEVLRAIEAQVCENHPEALILRTNAFGWSADPARKGWIETLLQHVETRRVVEQDHIRHATPILATDLAEIVLRAIQEDLTGTFHIAGAERVSPLKFTQRLASQFDLPWLAMRKETDQALCEVPTEFGEGECSLQTKAIRKALCVAMPLLSEGLERLREQAENGYRDRLVAAGPQSAQQRRAA